MALVVLVSLFWFVSPPSLLTIVCVLFLLVYGFEIIDTVFLNKAPVLLDLNLTGINTLLINNLNKYHPFLFYLSVGLFLVS